MKILRQIARVLSAAPQQRVSVGHLTPEELAIVQQTRAQKPVRGKRLPCACCSGTGYVDQTLGRQRKCKCCGGKGYIFFRKVPIPPAE